MVEHIEDFQKLNIRVNDIPEEHTIDVFIGTLKDTIQHEFHIWEPDSLENSFKLEEKLKEKLWKQGSLQIKTINMEVFFILAFHNLQGLHHNKWKKK